MTIDARRLASAIEATFRTRQTTLSNSPAVFEKTFGLEAAKQTQWAAFSRKIGFENPESFADVCEAVTGFLAPLVQSMTSDDGLPSGTWLPPSGWGFNDLSSS
jgi:hypothetical protein